MRTEAGRAYAELAAAHLGNVIGNDTASRLAVWNTVMAAIEEIRPEILAAVAATALAARETHERDRLIGNPMATLDLNDLEMPNLDEVITP